MLNAVRLRGLSSKTVLTTIITALLVVVSGLVLSAQDRYTLKSGKLAFADFRGYENWKDVAVSQTEL
jgi:hypothetical protein